MIKSFSRPVTNSSPSCMKPKSPVREIGAFAGHLSNRPESCVPFPPPGSNSLGRRSDRRPKSRRLRPASSCTELCGLAMTNLVDRATCRRSRPVAREPSSSGRASTTWLFSSASASKRPDHGRGGLESARDDQRGLGHAVARIKRLAAEPARSKSRQTLRSSLREPVPPR